MVTAEDLIIWFNLDMGFVVQMCELSRWKADIIIDDLTMPPIRGDVLLFEFVVSPAYVSVK